MAELLHFPSPVSDAAEREHALDVRNSWIVEAPAGSGKTGLLIQRYLKLLGDASVAEPEEVLAITFTVKATAEMRERVASAMEAASLGAETKDTFEAETQVLAAAALARDATRGWRLRESPRRLNIRTIDSVCAEIARSLPVVSGSGGRLRPVTDAEPLFRAAARRTMMQLGGGNRALDESLRTMLRHRDGDLGNCERLIAGILATRDQWGRLIPLDRAGLHEAYMDRVVLARLEQALDLAICQALTHLSRIMPEDVLRELAAAAAELAYLDGYKGAESPIALCAVHDEPPGERAEHLAHWRALVHLVVTRSSGSWRKGFNVNQIGFAAAKTHKVQLNGMIDRLRERKDVLEAMCCLDKLPPAKYPAEQWAVAKALFRVLSHALVELKLVFAERGQCDFAEMALAARQALETEHGADDLAAALGTRTKHLLVDEMQDTSTSQYELIERLTEGWDGRSQTVFLVGDPKQSIYRFRQARVERFVRTMQERRLGGLRLGCLRLTANFRSQRGLVERFNADFARLFPGEVDPAHSEEVPFKAATAVRGETEAEAVRWHVETISSKEESALARGAEARAVRRIAADWLARPLPQKRTKPWQVGVLVRSRMHLTRIVAELKRAGVPVRATEIDALGERQEVLDLLALTRALLHPADRVAWLAVLRAPWCGLELADLHRIAGRDDLALRERTVLDLMRERGHFLSGEGEERLARVWPVLEAAAGMRGRESIATLVERTWRSLGGDASLGDAEMANALRFFELLDELEAENGALDLKRLKTRMSVLYAAASTDEKAIELITIHRAKGLEWDVVIVPGMERKAPSERGRLLDWMEVESGDDGAALVVLAPVKGTGEESTALHEWIRSVNAARERAERKRLLYVACTRAREELHLFASPAASKGEVRPEPSSLLKTAWPVAQFAERPAIEWEGAGLALAASGGSDERKPAMLARLPLAYDPLRRFTAMQPLVEVEAEPPHAPFDRPEGSLAARAFGNAVHAFLQMAAERLAGGTSVEALAAEVSGWVGRAEAVLRGNGLAPGVVERRARRVVEALATTLANSHGRWILAAHPGAANEVAMVGWVETRLSVRLDRIFYAGERPGEAGDGCLWIVDYKTARHGAEGVAEFLERERAKYEAQMETYARSVARMRGAAAMRVALYYPVLGRLVWWEPESL